MKGSVDEGRAVIFRAFDDAMERRVASGKGRITMRQQINQDVCRYLAALEMGAQPQFYTMR